MNQIGTLSEKSLHAGLKDWCSRDGDEFEVEVDGFIIDVVRGDQLIEIQTRHLYAMKGKLERLLQSHQVRLLHPIAKEKWIVRQTAEGKHLGRRKSPKRGQVIDIFRELVRIPWLLPHPNLTIELLLTRQNQVLRNDGQGSWRRKKWSIYDHQLLEVVEQVTFCSVADYCSLIPADLPQPFTNRQLANALGSPPEIVQKMTYTLRQIGALTVVGKQGNAFLQVLSIGS